MNNFTGCSTRTDVNFFSFMQLFSAKKSAFLYLFQIFSEISINAIEIIIVIHKELIIIFFNIFLISGDYTIYDRYTCSVIGTTNIDRSDDTGKIYCENPLMKCNTYYGCHYTSTTNDYETDYSTFAWVDFIIIFQQVSNNENFPILVVALISWLLIWTRCLLKLTKRIIKNFKCLHEIFLYRVVWTIISLFIVFVIVFTILLCVYKVVTRKTVRGGRVNASGQYKY